MSIFDHQLQIKDFLKNHKAFALSTQDAEGEVYCAPLYFAEHDFLKLAFVSDAQSQHCQNLEQDPHVAAAVYHEGETIAEICGLQIMGVAERVIEKQSNYRMVYLEKYPELKNEATMYERFLQSSIYEIKVTWMRWIYMSDGKPGRVEGLLS
jgi:uncharacterized protein YhbP (UPF0306 family)